MGVIFLDASPPLRESAPKRHTADLSLIFVNRNFGSTQSGALCFDPSICGDTSLLSVLAQIDHFAESPSMCFEIIVVFVVRLRTANSCNVEEDGIVDV